MDYRVYLKYVLRILNVIISYNAAYYTYVFVQGRYIDILPSESHLIDLNHQDGIGAMLRPNSIGFREMYFHSFEKTILFSFAVFVVTFLLIEYVYRSRDKGISEARKNVYEALGAFKERNAIKNSEISKEVDDFFKG